jgi:hypothetical protein
METGLINTEQSNTSKALHTQAQATLAVITMKFVIGMIESSYTLLCTLLAMKWQCLNGHRELRVAFHRIAENLISWKSGSILVLLPSVSGFR